MRHMSARIPIAAISFHIGPYTSYDYILQLSLLLLSKIIYIYTLLRIIVIIIIIMSIFL